MKVGILLHPERGIDAVFEEARLADEQGFDSIWVGDHLMTFRGEHLPSGPMDSFTLMTALAARTTRVRIAWAMLNLNFRNPALLAKMLATVDHISKGRVICAVGSGWFEEEHRAYDLPWIADHDARAAFAREAIRLMRELWTHPAPERVTFEGEYVRVHELPFNPAPYQQPHPPIWVGGDSAATLETVKELGDGWAMTGAPSAERVASVRSAPDWPQRPMTLIAGAVVYVGETYEEVASDAAYVYERVVASGAPPAPTLEEYLAQAIVGTPAQCLERLDELESWGVDYIRLNERNPAMQEKVARLLLPRLA